MSEETIIYVVTEGNYSDYHIIGVFSTEEKAKRIMFEHFDERRVEEYILDDEMFDSLKNGYELWRVEMNGDQTSVELQKELYQQAMESEVMVNRHSRNRFVFYIWAKSQEHAIKIANDRRTQLIASGEIDAHFAKYTFSFRKKFGYWRKQ